MPRQRRADPHRRREVDRTGDDGSHFSLRPGDWMTIPRGWTGERVTPSPLRKVYVIWEAW